jgi:hypothetical protein
MSAHAQILADFRSQVTRLLQERDQQWEASRKLVGADRLPKTTQRLMEEVQRADVPQAVREFLALALNDGRIERIQDLPGPRLKELTGLPPTKALRALCVWFDLVEPPTSEVSTAALGQATLDALAQGQTNPFDALLMSEAPSLLDLGAGDLSFATELAEQYAPRLAREGRTLTLHCLDRLHPQSKLGGPLHPERSRLQALRSRADLSFQFFGDQDMFALERLDRSGALASRYTVVTCWAPATPTFVYEPTRLSDTIVERELRRTKGDFHRTSYGGEPALEVLHGARALLFPPWKFEIRGPLALLDLIARRGQVGLLGAVDSQVFWELLAQLLDDRIYRPIDQPFNSDNIPTIFGEVYRHLSGLPIGTAINLTDCGALRKAIPHRLPSPPSTSYRFRSVVIRRGAVFSGFPASSTARRFHDMVEETPPWMLTLVPEP